MQSKNEKNIDALEAAREQSYKRKQMLEVNSNYHPNQEPSIHPEDIKEEAAYKDNQYQVQSNGILGNNEQEEQENKYAMNRPKNNNLEDHQNIDSANTQTKRQQQNDKVTTNGQLSQEESPINDSPQNVLLMNSPPPHQNPFNHIPLQDQDRQQIKRYQTHILMLQGKAYLELKKPKHALKKLQTALKLNQRFYGEEHVSNASIYTILSQVYSRQKNFNQAIGQLETVWELTQASRGPNSKSLASVHLELADVYYKQRDLNKAIQNQKRGYEIFMGINQSKNNTPQKEKMQNAAVVGPEIIASVALTLSEWLQKAKRIEEAMDILSKVEEIYQYIFGGLDRRTTKVKRSIAMLYLKLNEYEKALEVFKVVQELEKTVYGKDSLQAGKTLKVMGTIQIILNNPSEARQVLQEAALIFKMKGQNKMLKQVYNKLRLLQKTIKGGNKMVIENVTLDEQDEMQNHDGQLDEDEQKKNEIISTSQIEEVKENGINNNKNNYPRSGSRKLKNLKMNPGKSKKILLEPLHKSSGVRTYKSSSSAFSQYQNEKNMPPSPLRNGYPLEKQKNYYESFHQKTISPLNQRAISGKNGNANSIGFQNGYYRNVGGSKKRMKKAISQGSIRNPQPEYQLAISGSSRAQLPQQIKIKNNNKNINKMMAFPPKLPRNAWASPPKNQANIGGRKSVNRTNINSNSSNLTKKQEEFSETERVTSLPYLSSPPPQQQQQQVNKVYKNHNNSKGNKVFHQRTGGGQKIVFS